MRFGAEFLGWCVRNACCEAGGVIYSGCEGGGLDGIDWRRGIWIWICEGLGKRRRLEFELERD